MLGRTLLACATFVVAAVAQSQIIAFTNAPTSIKAGQNVELTWAGGDDSPVTLTLQQGLPSDLQTVQLITGSATGTSFTWPVPSTLPNANNYAFKIQQGDNPPNYTGMVTLTGGATSGPTLAVSALATSSSAAASSTGSSSSVPTNPASGGVIGVNGSGSNSTTPSPAGNATTTITSGTAIVGTGAVGSGSAATGTALSRNTTMSHATLTTSSSSSSSSSTSSSSSSTGSSTTSSGPAPSSSKTGAAIRIAASNFALLCAAVVGIAYLG